MLDDARKLPDDPSELKQLVTLLASELKNRDLKIADLQHRLAGHNRHRFGSSSESLDQLQLTLENEEIAVAAVEPSTPQAAGPEAKAKPRRKPLPNHLDRNETVIAPGDACAKCGGDLKTLGQDVTEELEYVPGRFVVNRFVRPRMACACCEAICQAPLPSRPIERGRPGPVPLPLPLSICMRSQTTRSLLRFCPSVSQVSSFNRPSFPSKTEL